MISYKVNEGPEKGCGTYRFAKIVSDVVDASGFIKIRSDVSGAEKEHADG